jgi:hypothetical protein
VFECEVVVIRRKLDRVVVMSALLVVERGRGRKKMYKVLMVYHNILGISQSNGG